MNFLSISLPHLNSFRFIHVHRWIFLIWSGYLWLWARIQYTIILQPIIINGLRWMNIKAPKRLRKCDGNYIKIEIRSRDQHFSFSIFFVVIVIIAGATEPQLLFHTHWIKWIFKFPSILLYLFISLRSLFPTSFGLDMNFGMDCVTVPIYQDETEKYKIFNNIKWLRRSQIRIFEHYFSCKATARWRFLCA